MPTAQANAVRTETNRAEVLAEARHETLAHWPVRWSGVGVGALAAVAAVLLFGLIGVAVGAHLLGPEHRVVDLKKIGLMTLAFSVFSAFLSFVIGGWVAGKIAGVYRSESGMLHGAIAWLAAMPLLVVLAGLGAGSYFGAWYAGLAGTPPGASAPYSRPEPPAAGAADADWSRYRAEKAEYDGKVKQWQDDTPKVARNGALGAVTALLLGLMGSVVGGWMASGEPMNFTHHRTRREPGLLAQP